MAIIACKECGGQVSTKAEKCPGCGAPFKDFMPKAKGFTDYFSEDRVNARQKDAKAKTKEATTGCLANFLGLIALLVLLIVAVGFLS